MYLYVCGRDVEIVVFGSWFLDRLDRRVACCCCFVRRGRNEWMDGANAFRCVDRETGGGLLSVLFLGRPTGLLVRDRPTYCAGSCHGERRVL